MADRLPHVDVAGWLLGDLEYDEYARTAAHLAACEECRDVADELRATAEWALSSGPEAEPSGDLADRIVAAIDAEANPVPVTPPEGLTAADLTRTDLELPDPVRPARPDRTEPTGRTGPAERPELDHPAPSPAVDEPADRTTAAPPADPRPLDAGVVEPTDAASSRSDAPTDEPARAEGPVAEPDEPVADHDTAPEATPTATTEPHDPAADPATPAAPVPAIESPDAATVPAADDDTRGAGTIGPDRPDRPSSRRDSSRPGDIATGRRSDGRDLPRWLRPAVAAIAVAAVVLVAVVLGTGGGPPGEVELQAQLAASGADTSAGVTVRRLDSGRAVDVTSDNLPILPDGGIYELWFVGPGDTSEQPNRISAGTFHPDADGTTDVVLHAAVVPTDYPTVVITAEPNDGDPAVNGPEVLRSPG